MPIPLDPQGASVQAGLRILNAHIGAYAIDIWDDSDGSGTPSAGDKFLRRAKDFDSDASVVDLGPAPSLHHKTVRFIWGVTAGNTGDTKTRVEVTLRQGNSSLPGFPKTIEAPFRDHATHDVFSVFYFLT
jgi:hypothetical protein